MYINSIFELTLVLGSDRFYELLTGAYDKTGSMDSKDQRLRRRMLRLLALIPEKKSLLLAQKALNVRDINKIMAMFAELNVSPVTISKRHDVKYLKNLYDFFS